MRGLLKNGIMAFSASSSSARWCFRRNHQSNRAIITRALTEPTTTPTIVPVFELEVVVSVLSAVVEDVGAEVYVSGESDHVLVF